MNVNDFGKIFSRLRIEHGLTQEEIAKKLGVSKSTIGMWEIGKRLPSPELYEAIADFFNVDMDYLYGRSDVRQRIHYDNDGTAYIPIDMNLESAASLRLDENQLLSYYNKLNHIGMGKAMEYVQDLSEQPKYIEPEEAGVEEPVKKRKT